MFITKRQGFTLVELMVVIVIIGVLASLAIPRFTQASDRAKVAEAPRIIGSYESAYAAAVAEIGNVTAIDQLVFEMPGTVATGGLTSTSKFFDYEASGTGLINFRATPVANIGKYLKTDGAMGVNYDATTTVFTRCAHANALKLAPNFNNTQATTLSACS